MRAPAQRRPERSTRSRAQRTRDVDAKTQDAGSDASIPGYQAKSYTVSPSNTRSAGAALSAGPPSLLQARAGSAPGSRSARPGRSSASAGRSNTRSLRWQSSTRTSGDSATRHRQQAASASHQQSSLAVSKHAPSGDHFTPAQHNTRLCHCAAAGPYQPHFAAADLPGPPFRKLEFGHCSSVAL